MPTCNRLQAAHLAAAPWIQVWIMEYASLLKYCSFLDAIEWRVLGCRRQEGVRLIRQLIDLRTPADHLNATSYHPILRVAACHGRCGVLGCGASCQTSESMLLMRTARLQGPSQHADGTLTINVRILVLLFGAPERGSRVLRCCCHGRLIKAPQ